MKKTKYQTTKQQCQKQIDELDNVCDRCGRKIIPIKTVNNGGEPTYWPGCMHGQTGKDAWGHFTQGVKKWIFDLASKLVLEDSLSFGMSVEDKEFEKDNIRTAQIPDLQKKYGFDLSIYKLSNKRQVLRNCVEPEVAKHILHYAQNPIKIQGELL